MLKGQDILIFVSITVDSVNVLGGQRISDLVMSNTNYAKRLYYLGINFFEHPEATLEQLTLEKGLTLEKVITELDATDPDKAPEVPLDDCPLDLVVGFLKHEHHRFVKHKLPYLNQLVENIDNIEEEYVGICRDLKVLYPLFHEDFIKHIYEEEDTLFKYILDLVQSLREAGQVDHLLPSIEKKILPHYAREHVLHDDEMHGIRKIARNYQLTPSASLHVKVLYAELIKLEKNLQEHARIENEILFPKAIDLEKEVYQKYFAN